MKKQTFITVLEDNSGKMINFERWSDKQLKTVEKKVIELYSKYFDVYKQDILKGYRIELIVNKLIKSF